MVCIMCYKIVLMFYNGLRICEVRIAETLKLNTNLNGVFHIYVVSTSFYYVKLLYRRK